MTRPIDRALELLKLADRDIIAFEALIQHPEVDIAAPGFFAQQAVEKCLKAVLEFHGVVFRRTHDVDELVDRLRDHDVPMPFPADRFSVLNPFAVLLRYEGVAYVALSPHELKRLVETARNWASEVVA
jgi:HEPN domain-containing protein